MNLPVIGYSLLLLLYVLLAQRGWTPLVGLAQFRQIERLLGPRSTRLLLGLAAILGLWFGLFPLAN